MFSIQLARQGQTMEQGTIVRWLKQPGEDIRIGEELYEIETEKAVVVIEATRPGRLLKLLAEPGETVPVGAVLALGAEPGEEVSLKQIEAAIKSGLRAEEPPAGAGPGPPDSLPPSTVRTDSTRVAAMPKARALARELNVDLASVAGSGADGMILPEDVRRASEQAPLNDRKAQVSASALRRVPLSTMGRATVSALESAWRVPQFTQGILIDASALVRARDAAAGRLSYLDFFLDAIVRAAQAVPEVLAQVNERETLYRQSVDISIATATERGLLIPVLRNCAAMSAEQRRSAWRALIEATRGGKLTPQQMTGGIIALSNLGTRGIDYGTPLLPLGHSAIVFFGELGARALVIDDHVEARASLHIAVTFDHRVVDGVLGSRFTKALGDALRAPSP
jgi:pyruvate dehydrogenase E2 component (dihydrolipoamide acetyltransferase)